MKMSKLIWNKKTICDVMTKYFHFDKSEVDKKIDALEKRRDFTSNDKKYIMALISAVDFACDKFETSERAKDIEIKEKDRQDAGKAILQKHDCFGCEMPEEVEKRVEKLFDEIVGKGINIYKTINKTVLRDGNMKNSAKDDFDKVTGACRAYDTDRDFEVIYYALLKGLHINQKEANAIVEQAPASIIGGVYASKVKQVVDTITDFSVYNEKSLKICNLFKIDSKMRDEGYSSEVLEAIKKCPSILRLSTEHIKTAFDFVQTCATDELIQNAKTDEKTDIQAKAEVMKSWIGHNLSVLTIKLGSDDEKESIFAKRLLIEELCLSVEGLDSKKIFDNPIKIKAINSLKSDDIKENAVENIELLQECLEEKANDFIENNVLVLGMNHDKLKEFLDKILNNGKRELLLRAIDANDNLLKKDKSLEKVYEMIVDGRYIMKLDTEKMSDCEAMKNYMNIVYKYENGLSDEMTKFEFDKFAYITIGCGNDVPSIETLEKNIEQLKTIKEHNKNLSKFENRLRAEYQERRAWMDDLYVGLDVALEKAIRHIDFMFRIDEKKYIKEHISAVLDEYVQTENNGKSFETKKDPQTTLTNDIKREIVLVPEGDVAILQNVNDFVLKNQENASICRTFKPIEVEKVK